VDGLARGEVRQLADSLRQKHGSVVVVLGREEEGKAALLVAVTPDLKKRLPAGRLVRELAEVVGGRGGGRPDLAEAGGKSPEKLDEALSSPVLERILTGLAADS
jgi:alanyl-tRNA synthetase